MTDPIARQVDLGLALLSFACGAAALGVRMLMPFGFYGWYVHCPEPEPALALALLVLMAATVLFGGAALVLGVRRAWGAGTAQYREELIAAIAFMIGGAVLVVLGITMGMPVDTALVGGAIMTFLFGALFGARTKNMTPGFDSTVAHRWGIGPHLVMLAYLLVLVIGSSSNCI